MPKFTMVCSGHDIRLKKVVIRKSTKELQNVLCPVCHHPMTREDEPATSRITEVLDNGFMSRRVERPADAERLYKERADADQTRIKNRD